MTCLLTALASTAQVDLKTTHDVPCQTTEGVLFFINKRTGAVVHTPRPIISVTPPTHTVPVEHVPQTAALMSLTGSLEDLQKWEAKIRNLSEA